MSTTPSDPATARLDRLLRESSVVWLGTVRPDGAPHLVPIWFSWDGRRVFVASKPGAVKVRNLRTDPRVTVAVGDPDDDFDVGLFHGRAALADRPACDVLPPDHLERYREWLAATGLDEAGYWATYSQAIVIEPERCVAWHGRTVPRSAEPGAVTA